MAAEQFGGQIQHLLPRPVFAVQEAHAGGEFRAVHQGGGGIKPRPFHFATHIAGGDFDGAVAADALGFAGLGAGVDVKPCRPIRRGGKPDRGAHASAIFAEGFQADVARLIERMWHGALSKLIWKQAAMRAKPGCASPPFDPYAGTRCRAHSLLPSGSRR